MPQVKIPPPPPREEPREVPVGFRFPKALDDALIRYAKDHGLTKSSAAVYLLSYALEHAE